MLRAQAVQSFFAERFQGSKKGFPSESLHGGVSMSVDVSSQEGQNSRQECSPLGTGSDSQGLRLEEKEVPDHERDVESSDHGSTVEKSLLESVDSSPRDASPQFLAQPPPKRLHEAFALMQTMVCAPSAPSLCGPCLCSEGRGSTPVSCCVHRMMRRPFDWLESETLCSPRCESCKRG